MSAKNYVFEALFEERYEPTAGRLTRASVSLDEVADAIRHAVAAKKIKLSDRNPANFIKDYLRSANRNAKWPKSIRDRGFTARQTTGGGRCFEFVELQPNDEPFPDDYGPTGAEEVFYIQTLSLPVSTRNIVRNDEQSLAQLAVKLNVVEHFLATSLAATRYAVREITHLQNNVKLKKTEIDALYKAVSESGSVPSIGAVAVEVKIKDPIIAEQIEKQAIATLQGNDFEFCIPVILKRISKGEILAMHLAQVRRKDITFDKDSGEDRVKLGPLAHSAIYKFSPALPRV